MADVIELSTEKVSTDAYLQLAKTFANALADNDKAITINLLNQAVSTDFKYIETTLKELINTLLSDDVLSYVVNENDSIILTSQDVDYVFVTTRGWFGYWKENNRRLNKLRKAFYFENESSPEQPKIAITEMTIGVATLTEDGLKDLEVLRNANKQDCLRFMNNNIIRRYDFNSESFVVFCLNYSDGDENNLEKWFGIDELVQQGKIKLV